MAQIFKFLNKSELFLVKTESEIGKLDLHNIMAVFRVENHTNRLITVVHHINAANLDIDLHLSSNCCSAVQNVASKIRSSACQNVQHSSTNSNITTNTL